MVYDSGSNAAMAGEIRSGEKRPSVEEIVTSGIVDPIVVEEREEKVG